MWIVGQKEHSYVKESSKCKVIGKILYRYTAFGPIVTQLHALRHTLVTNGKYANWIDAGIWN